MKGKDDEIADENTDKQQGEGRRRTKKSDLRAIQDRLDSIATVVETIEIPDNLSPDQRWKIRLITRLADGTNMDEIITEVGRKTLGLD